MSHELSQGLKSLGSNTVYETNKKSTDDILERFPVPSTVGTMTVSLDCPEFTALCPKTQQPDFGKIEINYIPDGWCVESKSMKVYLGSFRNEGHFHEEVIATIHDKLRALLDPKWLKVKGNFYPRGGISINPKVESVKE